MPSQPGYIGEKKIVTVIVCIAWIVPEMYLFIEGL